MLKKSLSIVILLSVISVRASDDKIDHTKFWFGVATKNTADATKDFLKAVVMVDEKFPGTANKVGSELIKGAVTELAKPENRDAVKQIGSDFIEGALKTGGAMVTGAVVAGAHAASAQVATAATGVKLAAVAKGSAALTTAKTTGAAACAAVIASPVIPVLGVAALFAGTVWAWQPSEEFKREAEFSRCLRRNFECTDLNDRGFSNRCNSPERRVLELSKSGTLRHLREFRALKKEGKKPKGEFLEGSYLYKD